MTDDPELDRSKYEFRMVLGVANDLRDIIVKRGHALGVYVPYGKNWYGYSTRRLRENPAMAGHVRRAIFKG